MLIRCKGSLHSAYFLRGFKWHTVNVSAVSTGFDSHRMPSVSKIYPLFLYRCKHCLLSSLIQMAAVNLHCSKHWSLPTSSHCATTRRAITDVFTNASPILSPSSGLALPTDSPHSALCNINNESSLEDHSSDVRISRAVSLGMSLC